MISGIPEIETKQLSMRNVNCAHAHKYLQRLVDHELPSVSREVNKLRFMN